MERFGIAGAIICNTDLMIVDGHSRKAELIENGITEVTVSIPSRTLTEKEYLDFNALIDLAKAGETDMLLVETIIGEELMNEFELESANIPEAEEDDFEVPPLDEIKTDIVAGDLFEIREHRLLCGDSTNAENVKKLMNGELADMVFTDPPYGVNYDGGHANEKRREKLKGDDTTALYPPTCLNSFQFSKDNAPLYLWHAAVKGYAAAAAGYEIRCEIIWNKNMAQFGAIGAQYKQKHEPCFYCFKKGKSVNWIGENNEVTVWDCNRSSKNEFHPTQKPIELCQRAIGNHEVHLILDLFGGSGSTMVACHQLKKVAYLQELDVKYCQVILDRMIKLDPSLEIRRNGMKYTRI